LSSDAAVRHGCAVTDRRYLALQSAKTISGNEIVDVLDEHAAVCPESHIVSGG
jgi:hypothetical protein